MCKDHSQIKIRITLNKTFTITTMFTRIPTWILFETGLAFFGFNQPLTALELAKDVGSFSDKFHLFLCKQTADGSRFYTRQGIRVLVTRR